MTTSVIPASAADYTAVLALLENNQLPTADIDQNLLHFFVTKEGNTITAVIGLELFNNVALLRSMATAVTHRSLGLASALVTTLENYAAAKQVKSMYLLTTTARTFFEKRGYNIIERSTAPQSIQQSREFSTLCPASALVMKKAL